MAAAALVVTACIGSSAAAQSSTESDPSQAPAQQQMPGQLGQGMMHGQGMMPGQMGQGAMQRQMEQGMTMGPGMMMPPMNSAHGRRLFAEKGCVVCHSVNGIGGEDAPALDAATMSKGMNPFDFVAKMWRGAPAMIEMQNDELGSQIEFTGDELEDIIAFVHDEAEQKKFTKADIPPNISAILNRAAEEGKESAPSGMGMGKMKMKEPTAPAQ
ncbi:c-type cytochrome [Mesorhizobium sp.]|uniref:c-type cytochrome n=1 Tax=Mesorhizobium sp. TaxID=1871066 RepID=UPI0025F14FCE|nr:c-type cytochrome [Mesorhizobium sp.]